MSVRVELESERKKEIYRAPRTRKNRKMTPRRKNTVHQFRNGVGINRKGEEIWRGGYKESRKTFDLVPRELKKN